MRKISQVVNDAGTKKAVVYYESEYGEYVVKFYNNGVRDKNADYHTDDKDDAIATSLYEVSKV